MVDLNEANEIAKEYKRANCGNAGEMCNLPGCPNCDDEQSIEPQREGENRE